MRPDRAGAHLADVVTYCDRLLRLYARTSAAVLDEDTDERAAAERDLITIGEALVRLRGDAPDLLARLPLGARGIGMRNVLVHLYDRIEAVELDAALRGTVPDLRAAAAALLRTLDEAPQADA